MDDITNSVDVSLSKLWELVMESVAFVLQSMGRKQSDMTDDWTELNRKGVPCLLSFQGSSWVMLRSFQQQSTRCFSFFPLSCPLLVLPLKAEGYHSDLHR